MDNANMNILQENIRLVGLKADLEECQCNEFRKVLSNQIEKVTNGIKLSHKTNIDKQQAKEVAI